MKKTIVTLLGSLFLLMCFILTGCSSGDEITLELSYGERTGTYTGDMVDGLPDGQGKFTTVNEDGEEWTYEGSFKKGHFEGEGTTTWEDGAKEIGIYKNDVIQPISKEKAADLYRDPISLENHCVEIVGRVFTEPEYNNDIAVVQVWGDPEKFEKNTIMYFYKDDCDVHQDDYIKVTGIVMGEYTGENAFGAEVSAPEIDVREYEILDYAEALMPANKTLDVNQTVDHLGYAINIEKVEFADNEPRVFVKVDNKGAATFSLFTYSSKLVQNGKQYEISSNFEADYPEVSSEIVSGASSEGVLVFPAIEESNFTLQFEGMSENFEEEVEPYMFEINVK